MLVFFPTYAVMDDVMKRWKEANIWSKLKRAGGEIVVEKRSADAAQYKSNSNGKSSYGGGVNRNIFGGSAVKKGKTASDSAPDERPGNSFGAFVDGGEDKDDLNRVIVEFEQQLKRNRRV